jgi:hypothetical protein
MDEESRKVAGQREHNEAEDRARKDAVEESQLEAEARARDEAEQIKGCSPALLGPTPNARSPN